MSDSCTRTLTVTAPTNIAVIKYWGKRCLEYNLPLNSSLSVTLNQNELKTTTTISTNPDYEEDTITLNGEEKSVSNNKRLKVCLQEIRRIARKQCISKRNEKQLQNIKFYSQKVHIISENSFPTAAGLASSASGYAALVYALAQLYEVQGDITQIARQGSGSACRSLHGGFVEWQAGEETDGRDSIGVQLYDELHWPDLRVLILVVNADSKTVGSTEAMNRSVETSAFLKHRAKNIVHHRLAAIKEAISTKDFTSFAEIMMRDSNQLHAVCGDSYPPVNYLSDTSQAIINLVHEYNNKSQSVRLAYTFDAGPNACLFTTSQFLNEISSLILETFPPAENNQKFFRGFTNEVELCYSNGITTDSSQKGRVQYVIFTRPGPGPMVIASETEIH